MTSAPASWAAPLGGPHELEVGVWLDGPRLVEQVPHMPIARQHLPFVVSSLLAVD